MFILPGVLLVMLAALEAGLWCGCWLLALPAWGLLLDGWTRESPLPVIRVLKLLGLWVLGLIIFMLNGFLPIIFLAGFAVFVLPFILLVRLGDPKPRARPVQAASDILLAGAAVAVAVAIPSPEGSWTSQWAHAGGAATAGMMITYWAARTQGRSRQRLNGGAIL